MLPTRARLRRAEDIRNTLRLGQRATIKGIRLYARPNPAELASRVACVVGRSVDRSAVVRHRYQRWLRVLAAEALATTLQRRAYDVVLVALPGIKSYERLQQVRDALLPALKKIVK